jgi:hypothetical protein
VCKKKLNSLLHQTFVSCFWKWRFGGCPSRKINRLFVAFSHHDDTTHSFSILQHNILHQTKLSKDMSEFEKQNASASDSDSDEEEIHDVRSNIYIYIMMHPSRNQNLEINPSVVVYVYCRATRLLLRLSPGFLEVERLPWLTTFFKNRTNGKFVSWRTNLVKCLLTTTW